MNAEYFLYLKEDIERNAAISFATWLNKNGWQEYDEPEVYINLTDGARIVKSVNKLYSDFKTEQECSPTKK